MLIARNNTDAKLGVQYKIKVTAGQELHGTIITNQLNEILHAIQMLYIAHSRKNPPTLTFLHSVQTNKQHIS